MRIRTRADKSFFELRSIRAIRVHPRQIFFFLSAFLHLCDECVVGEGGADHAGETVRERLGVGADDDLRFGSVFERPGGEPDGDELGLAVSGRKEEHEAGGGRSRRR